MINLKVTTAANIYCMKPEDILLCRRPQKITVGQMRDLLDEKTEESKLIIIKFIRHRLHERYLVPLSAIYPTKLKSGFLMMAAACLMIETLECFREGQRDTERDKHDKTKMLGREAFRRFFENNKVLFPEFNDPSVNFYRNIRCGILHQAQSQGGFRILRRGEMLDIGEKSINAEKFINALTLAVDKYINELKSASLEDDLWLNAARKVQYICDACEVDV